MTHKLIGDVLLEISAMEAELRAGQTKSPRKRLKKIRKNLALLDVLLAHADRLINQQ